MSGWPGGAEVSSTRRRSPEVNLRLSLRVVAWNVRSRREHDHLSLLLPELKCLNVSIAALSEVWRPDGGKIMVGGDTNYWSGCSNVYHAQAVAVAVSNYLTPMIIEVTLVNDRVMKRRIHHSLGVVSLVTVFALRQVISL